MSDRVDQVADRLVTALRARYRTPANVVRALGLDPKAFAMDAKPGHAMDEDDDEMKELLSKVLDLAGDHLGNIAKDKLTKRFARDQEMRDAQETLEGKKGAPAAMDEPNDVPGGGMPQPGGNLTPIQGRDQALRHRDGSTMHNRWLAQNSKLDAAAAAISRRAGPPADDYAKRWPSASRIQIG